ncbi:MAG TPA: hypothetical protein P5267_02965 [Patescibacteria group bacterium]|nr:hypothetical protein [Patescibacteria group bacterium]
MKNNYGFTLIEQIIYLSLVLVIITVLGGLEQGIIRSSATTGKTNELRQAGRLVIAKISQEIKTAQAITSLADKKIILTNSTGETLEFYLDESTGIVYYHDNTGEKRLSSEKIKVTNLTFTALGQGAKIDLTLTNNLTNLGTSLELFSAAIPRQALY